MTDYAVLRDLDERMRALNHELTKLRVEALKLATLAGAPDSRTAIMMQRIDHMTSLIEAPGLTHYRQAERAAQPPVDHLAPEDLRCKLCGEEKEAHEFFFDDGQGNYGYTGRCTTCRSLPKRKRAKIADARGLTRKSERDRAIGRTVGR